MVKDKSKVIRTYDSEGFKLRASCICVRSEEALEVLLISSTGKPGMWKLPGGGLEPGEESRAAASREVLEEAGVVGILGRSLGVFENPEQKERTEVYVMIVTQELDEWEESIDRNRKRQWFRIEEAIEKVALYKPLQRNYLQELCPSKIMQTLA
ncbi:diphosphoinositol polyphosphate phosphohydrolase 1-like [Coccinella septempunctata]|uniref:diphosphoinositol polyphosphate phosphohydrolase 1-like n=1 Tax=Coccinella septempunctata TaxID=41139 RepID=UPI001D06698F|nr:diphosphoinositol polyphosphate phosphohydrolase 1-like [Coccinella septempunctata]XP_044765675.1 diphosphoinositol polyphosphate phosphohydrolase 1-like [Coccinella septempunctata]